jgi:hypothetical protein
MYFSKWEGWDALEERTRAHLAAFQKKGRAGMESSARKEQEIVEPATTMIVGGPADRDRTKSTGKGKARSKMTTRAAAGIAGKQSAQEGKKTVTRRVALKEQSMSLLPGSSQDEEGDDESSDGESESFETKPDDILQ